MAVDEMAYRGSEQVDDDPTPPQYDGESGAANGSPSASDPHPRDDSPLSRDFSQENPRPWSRLDYSSAERFNTNEGDRGPAKEGDRSSAQTRFKSKDVSVSDRAKWEWLRRLNQNVDAEEESRAEQLHDIDVERFVNLVTSKLGYSDSIEQRITWLLERIDVQDDLGRQTSIQAAILAISSLVIDAQRTEMATRHTRSVLRDPEFQELRSGIGASSGEIKTIRERVRDIEAFDSE